MSFEFKYPGVEIFHSIQGEGFHSGSPMTFIRLAGCNVGRQVSLEKKVERSLFPVLEVHDFGAHTMCRDIDGNEFLCDTDYRSRFDITPAYLDETPLPHNTVSITGGEPFVHSLSPLLYYLRDKGKRMHIETSGTRPIAFDGDLNPWIVCSPKFGLLDENIGKVHEWKLLVDSTDGAYDRALKFVQHIISSVGDRLLRISIQPINGIGTEHHGNLLAAAQIAQRLDVALSKLTRPYLGMSDFRVRVSPQLHKHLNVA